MRPTLVGLALMMAASIAAPADAQGGRQWIGISNPDGAALIYGTPQSDDSAISFGCARATKALTVSFIFEPVGARDGMRID
ncbi:MAG: hypothetical protein KIT36_24270, partial [Alphaproteobacteria bacterium]|nr:hypothetical protein [Alphaproteobacteria bacterium]